MPEIDAKEALTRKLGPLPAWGWGVAIGGAILAVRVIRPSSKSTASTGTTGIGAGVGSGPVIGDGGDATPTDPFSGSNSLVGQLQEQVKEQSDTLAGQQDALAGLSGTIGTLTNFQALQTELSRLINLRTYSLARASDWKTRRAACTTDACRTTATEKITTYTNQSNSYNTSILGIQKQLNGSAS